MMSERRVLVIDDEEHFLSYVCSQLTQRGLTCIGTTEAEEALAIAMAEDVGVILVDEVLLRPGSITLEKQKMQGRDLVERIHEIDPNKRFFFISSHPQQALELRMRQVAQSNPELTADKADYSRIAALVLSRAQAELRTMPGVVDLIDKILIEFEPKKHFDGLADQIVGIHRSTPGEVVRSISPSLLIGFCLEDDTFGELRKMVQQPTACWLPVREVLQALSKKTADPISRAEIEAWAARSGRGFNEAGFLLLPGSKRLQPCPSLRTSSLYFKILRLLAQRACDGRSIGINQADYDCLIQDRDPDEPARGGDDGRRKATARASAEGLTVHRFSSRALTKQINELRAKLVAVHLVHPHRRKQLFSCVDGIYVPNFQVELAVLPYSLIRDF